MASPNSYIPPRTPEVSQEDIENFIGLKPMRAMVGAALADRVDENGRLLPLQEDHYDVTGGGRKKLESGWRTDLVLPPDRPEVRVKDGKKIMCSWWEPSAKDTLYETLVRAQVILDTAAIEGLRDSEARLAETVEASSEYTLARNQKQVHDSYRIEATFKIPPEFAQTRIYVSAGVNGMNIARHVVKAGAHFDYAKMWVPDLHEGTQSFRRDTPIFEVNTFSQLGSIVGALHNLAESGLLPQVEDAPMVGMPIEGLPGVYIGQSRAGSSFNGRMCALFGSPITEACNALPVQAGDQITNELLTKAAEHARILAKDRAAALGVNSVNHAFLEGQPVEEIVRTIYGAN